MNDASAIKEILVDGTRIHTTDEEVTDLHGVFPPDTPVFIVLWREGNPGSGWQDFYAMNLDGLRWTVHVADYHVKLRSAEFDPLDGMPDISAMLKADANTGIYIVQFVAHPVKALRHRVSDLGGEMLTLLPPLSCVVRMTPTVRDQVGALRFVRSVMPLHPAFRVPPALGAELAGGVESAEARRFSIMLFEPELTALQSMLELLAVWGVTVQAAGTTTGRIEAALYDSEVLKLVFRDEIAFIELAGEPGSDMDKVRASRGVNYLESLATFDGAGVRGEVMDLRGLRTSHVDFQHDPPQIHGCNNMATSTSIDHGTWCYGTIFGDGTGNAQARGLLPLGEGVFASWDAPCVSDGCCPVKCNAVSDPDCTGCMALGAACAVDAACCSKSCLGASGCGPPDRYKFTAELVHPNGPYRAVFQSNSWGNAVTTVYTTHSAEMDTIAFDLDLLICQSQGNTGSTLSRPEAWAKNVVSVGALKHFDTSAVVDDMWKEQEPGDGATVCSSPNDPFVASSRGQASDGRIKPNLSHHFDGIFTTHYFADSAYESCFGGTSAATPITCGMFGLMFQMWHEGVFNVCDGQTCQASGGGVDVFDSRPHAATARALMINTAYQYPLNQFDIRRENQGWGFADAGRLYLRRSNFPIICDECEVLTQGYSADFVFNVPAGAKALRATMVYADPPGTPLSSVHAVNDLNLKLTYHGGPTYYGNCGLCDSHWSSSSCNLPNTGACASGSVIDTVENVFVENPSATSWTAYVTALTVVEDGHVETPAIDDVDFALVISIDTDCDGNGTADADEIIGTANDCYDGNATHDFCESVPQGACCVGTACSIKTACACSAANGIYVGNGSACTLTLCQQS